LNGLESDVFGCDDWAKRPEPELGVLVENRVLETLAAGVEDACSLAVSSVVLVDVDGLD